MSTADSLSEASGTKPVIRFRHAVHSDVGRHRTENQDSYAFVYARESALFVVADGMGGARGGATASALAVDIIAKEAVTSEGVVSEESLRQAIEKANSAIFERSRRDEKLTGMGTTVVALAVSGSKALVAHVGDSRIYLLRSGKLSRLTRDHTLVQELIDSGAISSDQAENHPIAHMLTRSLGPVGAVDVEILQLPDPIELGDRFVLCSDGLYNMVAELEIEEIVSSREPEQAALDLVDLANDCGGTDNITVEIIEVFSGAEGESESLSPELQSSFTSAQHLNGDYGSPELDPDEPIELTSEQVVSDQAADRRSSRSTSAYDSIIFGEAPTADDIRKHEESVRRTQTAIDTGDAVSSGMSEAAESEFEEGAPQQALPGASEKKQQIQVGALAFLVFVLAFVAFLIVMDRPVPPPALPVVASAGSEASKQVESAASVVASVASSAVEDDLEREVLERELDASMGSVSSVSVSQQSSTQSSTVPDNGHAFYTFTDEKTSSAASVVVQEQPKKAELKSEELAQSSATDAWPTADVMPLGTKLLSEDDVVVAPPTASSATAGGAKQGAESPLYTDAAPAVDAEVAKVIADASDITVPTAPAVEIKDDKTPLDQQIVWEHEEIKIAKLAEAGSSASNSAPSSVSGSIKSEPVLLSDKEKQKVLVEKIDTRERIANIDAKLKQFAVSSSEESKQRLDEIENQLTVVADGVRQTTENLETAKRRFKVWNERKEALKSKDPKELASEVALSSVQVKRKKEAFEIASLRYLDAVELWRENPGNDQGASQMAALGKELESRRAELSEAVTSAVDTAISQARFDISEFSMVKEDLMRRRDRLNRHAGIAKVKPLTNSKARMERQRALLDERTTLTAKLKALREKLSDQEETDFRRELALRVVGIK